MLKAKKVVTDFGEKKSDHILYCDDDFNNLVVIFPGGGNSCNRPILHYSRKFLLERGCDVLNISYDNLVDDNDSTDVQMERLASALYEAIVKVKKVKEYEKVIFIARSFGNIISNQIKIKESLDIYKSIYMSPTFDATKYFEQYPGLIITGTNDTYITDEQIRDLEKKYSDNILVFEQGTHGLENKNMDDTLDFCKVAVKRIIDYIGI